MLFGTNIGSEINKLRPVFVWRKHENKENHNDDAYFVFPMSSKRSKSIYKQNVQLNIDNKHNKVMVNQGRLLSRKRFVKIYKDLNTDKVYKLSEEEINKIKRLLSFILVYKK
ncbi:MAG: type II toxin-antitoxin system PemK/MazF family toxin [Clostridia bacterium]|nr:type II toxin-antitoxin system PemK/MazF family toxin [Clostridia bacterium]